MSVQMKCHFGEFDPEVLEALKEAYNQDANSFAESCDDTFDFKTCKRDNGTVYGIPDKSSCNVGKEVRGNDGGGMMTDARMSMGKDPKSLDLDVMQYVGPDVLTKIMADNIGQKNDKEKQLFALAFERASKLRSSEVFAADDARRNLPNWNDLANGLGMGVAMSQALNKRRPDMGEAMKSEFAKAYAKAMTENYPVVESQNSRMKALASGEKEYLADLASGINGSSHPMAKGMAAALDEYGKNIGMKGAPFLEGLSNMPNTEDRLTSIAAMIGASGSGKDGTSSEVMANGFKTLQEYAKAGNKKIKEMPNRGTKAPDVPKSKPKAAAKPERRFSHNHNGSATFIPKGKPPEQFTLQLSDEGSDVGYYKGEWSDGFKTDYQFGPNGDVRIITGSGKNRDVSAGRYTAAGSGTSIVAKKGSRTVIPSFTPQQATGPLEKVTPAK